MYRMELIRDMTLLTRHENYCSSFVDGSLSFCSPLISNFLLSSLPMLKSVHRLYEILGVPLVDGFVFTLGNGRPVGMTSVARWLDDGAREAGLRRISPHCLRDSCATWLFSSGTDIRLVSRWLRHSSISVTMDCYLRLYGNELGDLGRKVDSMMEGMLMK